MLLLLQLIGPHKYGFINNSLNDFNVANKAKPQVKPVS